MDRKWWTLIAVCVGTFMLLLDVTIVNVALPDIQSSLHADFSDLQWVIDAYSLVLAALLLTTGSLADLFGRRRLFVIGLVIFTGSSLGSGLAQSPLMLNLFRGAQGVGGAAMFSTSLALLGSAFQGRERGTAFGVWGAITGLAVAIGPVIGGALTSGLSWRWIFLVNVPIGILAVFLTLLRVEESRQPGRHRVDPIGVITFSGALGALVLAFIKADEKGWGSTYILVLLAGAVAGIVLFLLAEALQRDRAMFDLTLFRKPTFTGGNIAAFALSGGLFALFLYLTLYLQDILGYSALQTGFRFLVLSGGILLTSTLAGRLTATVPIRFLIAPGLALVGAGLLLMRGVDAGTHWEHLIPGFIISGIGVGFINPPLASTAIGVVAPERAGMASGINSTFRQVGIATGIAGLGTLFTTTVTTRIVSLLHGTKGVSGAVAHQVADTVSQGSGAKGAFAAVPAKSRPVVEHAVKAGFTHGLDVVFLIGALLSFAAAVLTFVLIRSKDFEASSARGSGAAAPAGSGAETASAGEPREPEPEPEAVASPTAGETASAGEGSMSGETSPPDDVPARTEQPGGREDAPATADGTHPDDDVPATAGGTHPDDDLPPTIDRTPASDEASDGAPAPAAGAVSVGQAPAAGAGQTREVPVTEAEHRAGVPTGEAGPAAAARTASLGVPFRAQPVPAASPPAPGRATEPPAAVPAHPVPASPAGAGSHDELMRSAQTLIDAAEQAMGDYERLIEREADRHREAELGAARAQAEALMASAAERSDAYAASLRERLGELSGERDRLVVHLRDLVRFAAGHDGRDHDAGQTRAELDQVIGELRRARFELPAGVSGTDQANGGRVVGDGDANGRAGETGDGTGRPERQGSQTHR